MKNKGVRLSSDEIFAERNRMGQIVPVQQIVTRKVLYTSQSFKNFTERLTDSQIREFFAKYDYIDFNKYSDNNDETFVRVYLTDGTIDFSDFDYTIITPYSPEIKDKAREEFKAKFNREPFDFNKFSSYCESIGRTPVDAINDDILKNLLGQIKGYHEARELELSRTLKNNFGNIPRNYQRHLKPALEHSQNEINLRTLIELLREYGSPDDIRALLQRSGQ